VTGGADEDGRSALEVAQSGAGADVLTELQAQLRATAREGGSP
jgi:hypothetical protein